MRVMSGAEFLVLFPGVCLGRAPDPKAMCAAGRASWGWWDASGVCSRREVVSRGEGLKMREEGRAEGCCWRRGDAMGGRALGCWNGSWDDGREGVPLGPSRRLGSRGEDVS